MYVYAGLYIQSLVSVNVKPLYDGYTTYLPASCHIILRLIFYISSMLGKEEKTKLWGAGGGGGGTQSRNTVRKIGKYRPTVSEIDEMPIPHLSVQR